MLCHLDAAPRMQFIAFPFILSQQLLEGMIIVFPSLMVKRLLGTLVLRQPRRNKIYRSSVLGLVGLMSALGKNQTRHVKRNVDIMT
jgi:hypothetical protein